MSRAGVLVAVLLVAATAHADDKTAKRRAGELAAEAQQHYKRGEFEVSAALVRQAYALYPEPNLLYNLARSLEGMGDKKGALEAYQQYLATGKDIEDRGALERRVATMQAELDAANKPAEPPPTVAAPAPTPAPAPLLVSAPPFHEAPEEPASRVPLVVIGLGVLAAAGGGGCALVANNRHDDATSTASALGAQSLQTSAQHYATAANILFVAGGAIAIGGLVWEIHSLGSHRRASMTARARVAPSALGLEVSW